MKHTPGPVEASENDGPYPMICVVEAEYETWFVNAAGAVREEAGDDAKFIAWCYNNAALLEAAPAMYEALEAADAWITELWDWLEDYEGPGMAPDDEETSQKIAAALAAARGEES